ncbi:hypothetical protein E1H99_00695 [Enterococcus hirae]|nr:hypothetical protein E1H99_00695 [Enterococcus hirae]
MKKLFLSCLSLLFFFSLLPFSSVYANEQSIGSFPTDNYLQNVTPASSKGVNRPTDNWNVATLGKCSMSGNYGSGAYLYSNYNFLGKKTYNYFFQNQESGTLEVNMRHSVTHTILKSHRIPTDGMIASSLTMTDTGSRFYYEFHGTSDFKFTGYVQ